MTAHQSLLTLLSLAWSTQLAYAADTPRSVAFRLAEWKRLQFDLPADAQQQLETLKQLGCEAMLEQQQGRIDVRFRAVRWTKVTVDNYELAHEWEKWLKTSGFETLCGQNVAPVKGAVAVHYRMARTRTLHLKDAVQAKEFTAIYSGLGCAVQQAQHAGHIDLSVGCPEWRNMVFETHDEAHAIQKWLNEQGFQTQHNH